MKGGEIRVETATRRSISRVLEAPLAFDTLRA
jgi:hypothetical protein